MNTRKTLGNEQGAVLVLALLTVTVLAVFSLTAVIVASQGLRMSAQYKVYQSTLYSADGGAEFSPGIIKRAMASGMKVSTLDTGNALISITNQATLESELSGTTANSSDTVAASPNVILTMPGGDTVNLDIDYIKSKLMPGGSTESAARYEGIGGGTSGSVGIVYRVDALNTSVNGQTSQVRINFKCVEGGGRCL